MVIVFGLIISILCGCGADKENKQESLGDMTGIDVELAREAFSRMGYAPEFVFINWEDKKNLLAKGSIDCIWSSFTMTDREDEYHWAGPYMRSHQVVAVNEDSDIQTLEDLEGKVMQE